MCLVDDEDEGAESIRLNKSQWDPLPKGQPCELIALSLATTVTTGRFDKMLDVRYMSRRPQDSELYELYYVVMWVER